MFKIIWYVFMSGFMSYAIIKHTIYKVKHPIQTINYDDYDEETQLKIKEILTRQNKISNIFRLMNIIMLMAFVSCSVYIIIKYKRILPFIPAFVYLVSVIICEFKLGYFKFKKGAEE